jgi:hypothetical protein
VALCTSLSETFGSFSSSGHVGVFYGSWE